MLTRRDIRKGLASNLYILDSKKQKVNLRYNLIQRELKANLTGRDLVLKFRQPGISTFAQAELFLAATMGAASTLSLGYDDKNTNKLRRISEFFYDNLPDSFVLNGKTFSKPKRKYASTWLVSYPDTMSEMISITAGSTRAGRGDTFTHIHGSEVAFWKDAETLITGFLEAGDPQVILESTPNGAQGYFYELCMDALDGKSNWTLHFYEWWKGAKNAIPLEKGEDLAPYNDDELRLIVELNLTPEQIKFRRQKIRDLKHQFPQEYPEDVRECFLLSGIGYFGTLLGVFRAPMYGVFDGTHRHVAGLDWAQARDYTVLSVWDVTARQQVDMLRINRLSWGDMRRRIAEMCKKWNVRVLTVENNAESANIEELRALLDADPLYKPTLLEFNTTNASKAAALAEMHEAINEGGWTLQAIPEQKREFLAFQAIKSGNGWKYSAPAPEHDDTIIANMLALHSFFHGGSLQPAGMSSALAAHFLGDIDDE